MIAKYVENKDNNFKLEILLVCHDETITWNQVLWHKNALKTHLQQSRISKFCRG